MTACKSADKGNGAPKPGSWLKQDINADLVKKAYAFLEKEIAATHENIELKGVTEARTQPVAGYKLEIKCNYQKKNEQDKTLIALIFVDLEQVHHLENLKL